MSHIHIGLSGRYTIEKRNAAGDIVQTLEFDNLITDAGLERWGTGSVASICYLGGGAALPTVLDTAMAALLGSTSTWQTAPSTTYDVASVSYVAYAKWRFNPGVCTGDIREVGVGWGGGLWSRALVVDGNGNQVTIQKLVDETLDVTYAVKFQFPLSDLTGTINVDGVDRAWAARVVRLNESYNGVPELLNNGAVGAYAGTPVAFSSGLVAVNSYNSVGVLGTGSSTRRAYVAGSKQCVLDLVFPLNGGNGNIKTVVFGAYTYTSYDRKIVDVQVEFNPPITKLSTQVLSFVVQFSWGRA